MINADKDADIAEWVNEEYDIRDQWLGVKRIKSEYSPTPYKTQNMNKEDITLTQTAEATAEYLEKKQWGCKGDEDENKHNQKKTSE